MSDGERVIFYLLGHCLIASEDAVMVIDEPELHVHKAILGRLWDLIESERPDCSFVYITHDLDFVVARPTAAKLVVRAYSADGKWEIEPLPSGTGLPDRVVSELVGSRQPVLFVEGERGSVDATIYRDVYANFLIQPIGSCDAVVHAVASFRQNDELHRIGSVRGCIDADARTFEEVDVLRGQGIYVLPVAEVENILLLPDVFRQIAKQLHFSEEEATDRLERLVDEVARITLNDLETASVRHAVRRLDSKLKRLAPSARSISELAEKFLNLASSVDVGALAAAYRDKLDHAISKRDLVSILGLYDNKGLLSLGARQLGLKGREELTEFVGRLLASRTEGPLLRILREALPDIAA